MKDPAASSFASRLERFLFATTVFVATAFIGLYLYVALQRVNYPFELEWMEGGSVDHVARLTEGKRLYVEPTPEFVPFIYTPLYFYLSAALAKIVGLGFFPLRLLSLLSSLGCFALVGRFVQRETQSKATGLLAAGLFAATFQASGNWFDLGRVDSLFLLLILAGCYGAKYWGSTTGTVLAGGLLAAAFMTKQTALVVIAAVGFSLLVFQWRRALVLLGTVGLGIGGALFGLWLRDGEWLIYYVFRLPRQHAIAFEYWSGFWTRDVAVVALGFLLGAVYLLVRQGMSLKGKGNQDGANSSRGREFQDLCFAAGMLLAAWLSRLHSGGFANVLFPFYAAMAISAGQAAGYFRKCGRRHEKPSAAGWATCVLWLTFLAQFWFLRYSPQKQIPSAAHRQAWEQLVEQVRATPGRVIIPYHGYLARLAGKTPFAQHMAMADVERSHPSPIRRQLRETLEAAIREQQFDRIILDVRQWNQELLEKFYRHLGPPIENYEDLRPLTGDLSYRPWRVYLPRKVSAGR